MQVAAGSCAGWIHRCECPPQFAVRGSPLHCRQGLVRAELGWVPAGRLAPPQVPAGLTGAAPPGAQSSPGRCMTRGPMSAQKAHLAVSLGSRPSPLSGDGCCFWGPQNEGVIPSDPTIRSDFRSPSSHRPSVTVEFQHGPGRRTSAAGRHEQVFHLINGSQFPYGQGSYENAVEGGKSVCHLVLSSAGANGC